MSTKPWLVVDRKYHVSEPAYDSDNCMYVVTVTREGQRVLTQYDDDRLTALGKAVSWIAHEAK